jgi:hypothetical protein
MNKHAIVILYAGSDKDPGYDVIESLANTVVTAGLSVPELIEIKHFDSDSIGKAIIAKAINVKPVQQKSELLKQSVIYMVEKYKGIPEANRGAVIFRDAIKARHCEDDDSKAFNRAIDTITTYSGEAKLYGMGRRFIEMLVYAKENINDFL